MSSANGDDPGTSSLDAAAVSLLALRRYTEAYAAWTRFQEGYGSHPYTSKLSGFTRNVKNSWKQMISGDSSPEVKRAGLKQLAGLDWRSGFSYQSIVGGYLSSDLPELVKPDGEPVITWKQEDVKRLAPFDHEACTSAEAMNDQLFSSIETVLPLYFRFIHNDFLLEDYMRKAMEKAEEQGLQEAFETCNARSRGSCPSGTTCPAHERQSGCTHSCGGRGLDW